MKTRKYLLPVAAAGVLALSLSACAGGGGGGGGTTGGGDAAANLDGRGPITYVQGKDNSNVVRPLIEKWNAAHPNEKVTFKEQTDQADQQHDDLVQNFQAKNANYDVVSVDVVWTAEFAAKGWLQPLKDKMALDTSGMLKPTSRGRFLQGHPLRGTGIFRRRHPLLPQGPRPHPAQDLGRDDGHVLDRQDQQHRLLRRPVHQVRGTHGQRLRGDQLRRRVRAGRGRQAEPEHRRGQGRPGQPCQGLRGRQHPQGSHHLQGRGVPPGVPGRQAAVPAQLALRLQPGHHRGFLQGQGRAWHDRPPRQVRPRRFLARRPQRRHQRLLQEQGHRPGLPEVPHHRGDAEVLRHAGFARSGARPSSTTTRNWSPSCRTCPC